MTDTPLAAGPNRQITLTFSLKLVDGQLIDQVNEPATFVWGDESLLPAFQKALRGCKPGDKRSVFIQAKNGFGPVMEDNIQYFKPDKLAELGVAPAVGMMINFTDDHRLNMNEADVTGIVKAIDDDWVTVDFNHPLAGRDLMFGFEIIDVKIAPMSLGIPVRDTTLEEEEKEG